MQYLFLSQGCQTSSELIKLKSLLQRFNFAIAKVLSSLVQTYKKQTITMLMKSNYSHNFKSKSMYLIHKMNKTRFH